MLKACAKMIKETLGNVMPSIVKGLSMCLDVSYFSSFTIAELGLLLQKLCCRKN